MLGFASSTLEEGVLSLATAVKYLNKRMGIPSTLKECNIDEQLFEENVPVIAEEACHDICTAGNPKSVSKEDFKNLLKWAYEG